MYICMCMIEVIDNDTLYYVMLLIIYSLFKCIQPHVNFNNNPQHYSHTYNIVECTQRVTELV